MKPKTTIVTIPNLSDSAKLANWSKPGEPTVILKMTSIGNNQPFTYRAGDKTFMFRWSSPDAGHVLRVPLNLWMQDKAKLAHEMLAQKRIGHSIVVLFEMPKQPDLRISPPEMGAADTSDNDQNVVGLVEAPTAAPAVETPIPGVITSSESIPDAKAAPAIYDIAYDLTEAPKRIKELAALIGVPESGLREAIALPESRVEVTGPGWVRRKESQPA